jgi:hypothetical protein
LALLWAEARQTAPEQEESAFWQAVTLADNNPCDDAVARAAQIFSEAMAQVA